MAGPRANYYEVLGIERDASPTEVKEAYRRLAKQLHPDKNGGTNEAKERFQLLNDSEAYTVISDNTKRARYDGCLDAGVDYDEHGPGGNPFAPFGAGAGADGAPMPEIFEELFKGFFGAAQADFQREPFSAAYRNGHAPSDHDYHNRHVPLVPVRLVASYTLEEVAQGATKRLHFQRNIPCDGCRGTGAASRSQADVDMCKACKARTLGTGMCMRRNCGLTRCCAPSPKAWAARKRSSPSLQSTSYVPMRSL